MFMRPGKVITSVLNIILNDFARFINLSIRNALKDLITVVEAPISYGVTIFKTIANTVAIIMLKSNKFHPSLKYNRPNAVIFITASRKNRPANILLKTSLFELNSSLSPCHFKVKNKVLSKMETIIIGSNIDAFTTVRHTHLNEFLWSNMIFLGCTLTIKIFISSHSFCLSVSKKFFPSLSFSLLKVEITIPTKRLSMKKEAKTMKNINAKM